MVKFQSIANFCKKPGFILTLILIIFFLKGAFLATLFPIFVGQDEARHYNTVQFLSEPKEKTWPINKRIEVEPSSGPSTLKFNYTQEIKETALAADDGQAIYNTLPFTQSYDGENEGLINSRPWRQYNTDYPPNTAAESLYHILASYIEKVFGGQSILIRFYLGRIFSVFLGTLTILLSYIIIRTAGFSEKNSLIITAMVSFQPRFSIYLASVNTDSLLILIFAIFTYGAVLALKNGLGWKNLLIMIFAIIVGYHTKGTAAVLIGVLAALLMFFLWKKIDKKPREFKYAFFLSCLLVFLAAIAYFHKYLPLNKDFFGIITSLQKYLDTSLSIGRFALSARTYWGALTWVTSWFMDYIVNFIWYVEFFSAAGLLFFFFSKKQKPEYLPEKKYVVFLLVMIAALQLGIRAYDWNIFARYGSLDLGTPGRYFLPNLTAHLILVFTGIGALLGYFKKEKYFDGVLKFGMIAMFAFSLYLIFDVIVFRFYL